MPLHIQLQTRCQTRKPGNPATKGCTHLNAAMPVKLECPATAQDMCFTVRTCLVQSKNLAFVLVLHYTVHWPLYQKQKTSNSSACSQVSVITPAPVASTTASMSFLVPETLLRGKAVQILHSGTLVSVSHACLGIWRIIELFRNFRFPLELFRRHEPFAACFSCVAWRLSLR